MKLCECGCGKEVNEGNRFIHNHHWRGRKQSKEHTEKISKSNKGQKRSEETCKKISKANKGKKRTEEMIKRMSEALKGIPKSEEHRRKLSEAHKGEKNYRWGKHLSEDHKRKISESNKNPSAEIRKKMSEAHTGYKHSEETKQKISEAQMGEKSHMFGKKLSEETKRKMRESYKGKTYSEETRRKISESNSGEKSHFWNGGISFLPYCHKFNNGLKEKIRNRDNRTCQNCNKPENGRRHTVHHIHYDKENCYPDLITLCVGCNSKANTNRDNWESYYMNKLNDRGLLNWTLKNESL